MRKTVIVFLVISLLVGFCFVPFSYQKQVSIRANYFNVYQRLSNSNYWKFWYNDLNDSSTTINNFNNNNFEIKNKNLTLRVKIQGNVFLVSEARANETTDYAYLIQAQKFTDSTVVSTDKRTNVIGYLFGPKFDLTHHMDSFKLYMETPKLYYGFDITRKRLTDTAILAVRKTVASKDKFEQAKKSLIILKEYLTKNQVNQTQPLLAQFEKKGNDSTEVEVGVPVDRRVSPKNPIRFSAMPKTYSLYTLYYRGLFKDRVKAFAAVQNFYKDRNLQMPFSPLEIYLDNKLPTSENDTVYLEIKCPTY